ncbi:TRAFs-binding domain-containing protein [Chloroflexota bacterium]
MTRPLLFVAMPFGKKKDSSGAYEIDFDRVYNLAIKPAAEAVNVEVIRADEERSGGIIHTPMFERLLLAEIVIADVTIPNPNVFYELGVRHCARPRSTILIYGKVSQLPFDVFMIRALPYQLEDGLLHEAEAERLKIEIQQKLKAAKSDLEVKDSPLFQLIPKFPGIRLPHEVTESFRDRARYIDSARDQLGKARHLGDSGKAIGRIKEIEASLGDFNETHSEILVDLLLSYRDVEAFGEMVSLVERLPRPVSDAVTIREQHAFALNKRNNPGDRREAIHILQRIIDEHGYSPETCGLYGRIYKDLYEEAIQREKQEEAATYLNEAIKWYRHGFEADPRDYYPGINASTLLFTKGDEESIAELRMLVPAISFAVARRGGIQSQDYWDVATVLEAAVLTEDWEHARRAASRLPILDAPGWNVKTTLKNLRIIHSIRLERGLSNKDLDDVIRQLAASLEE